MVSVMLYPCILCVDMLMHMFVLCVCELFGETIRNLFGETIRRLFGCVVVIFLLNVMGVLRMCGGALLDIRCIVMWSSLVCL